MDLNSIMIGSSDATRLATYYRKLFGDPVMEMEGFTGWQMGSGWLTVGPHDDVEGRNPQPGRIMWNFECKDVRAEFERLRDAGAVVIREPYEPEPGTGMWIATLGDPDDNYFQLMSPM